MRTNPTQGLRVSPRFKNAAARRASKWQFTDRRSLLRAFEETLASLPGDEQRAMAFHGFGGIGKSTLLAELGRRAQGTTDAVVARVDFAVPAAREQETALYLLR